MSVKDYFLARLKRTSGWFKSLSISNKIAVSVAAVAFLAFIITIPIVANTSREAGFMHGCFINGHATYIEEGGSCGSREIYPIVLDRTRVPFTVAVSEFNSLSQLGSQDIRVLQSAINDINVQVGFQLFRLSLVDEDSTITIYFNQPISRTNLRAPGWTSHIMEENVVKANIYIRSDASVYDRTLFMILRHELLHSVGLAHDDFGNSIMYPYIIDESMLEDEQASRQFYSHITDRDRELLREAYRN